MLDIIAEFLIDAIGDLFESGADAAAEAAADAATDVGADAVLSADVLDPGATLAPPVDAATGGDAPFHPVSPTLRVAGFMGQV